MDREKRKTHLMYSLIRLKTLASCVLVCIAFLPQMHAAPNALPPPPPDGCYPGFTTAEGCNALFSLTSGAGNTAVGWYSLYFNTTHSYSTGVGAGALVLNNADSNTAVGAAAMLLNTTGHENTATGVDAMVYNGSGDFNDAFGGFALFNNTDGFSNNAVGDSALFENIHGAQNTAVGDLALANNYVGDFVGSVNPSGTPLPNESNTIRIGDLSNGNGAGSLACYIGGIFNNPQPVGGSVVEVTLDLSNDKLGWAVGPNTPLQVPQRAVPAPRGRVQPAAHAEHQAKLDNKVDKLEATVAQQQKQIETLTAQLGEQAAQIQKVSAQLEMVKPAPQMVENR